MKEFKSSAGRAYKLSRDEPEEPRAKMAFRRSMQARINYLGERNPIAVFGKDVPLDRVQVHAWEPMTCGCRLVIASEPDGTRVLLSADRVCALHDSERKKDLLDVVAAHNRANPPQEG